VATKTNSTQASEIDISSIKCLSYMSFHGVVLQNEKKNYSQHDKIFENISGFTPQQGIPAKTQ
jgi:hypothetical protein